MNNFDIYPQTTNLNKKLLLKWVIFWVLLFLSTVGITILSRLRLPTSKSNSYISQRQSVPSPTITPSPTPEPLPLQKILPTDYHVFQTFNNCGPAALSMALRFYGIEVSQAELGAALRPYQVAGGDNDDKSVTLEELAKKSKEYGFIPYHRPMGKPLTVKQFIANDMPVITRALTKPGEDIGHFRVVKGYDETTGTFIQDDSLQNKNLRYSYEHFEEIWKRFNDEFLVLVPREKEEIAHRILGENKDLKKAWQNAAEYSENQLLNNPDDIYARFNLSVAYYNIGDYQRSVNEFEKVEKLLSFRTLWYQIEPIEAYYHLGNYTRVFQLTDKILNNHNRAFSELYILRGKIYKSRGENEMAKQEFEKAVFYNKNLTEARDLLNSI